MKRPMRVTTFMSIALTFSVGLGVFAATIAQEDALTKPLNRYLVGDLFPRVVTESFGDTGRRWKLAADDLLREAEARRQSVGKAIAVKKTEMPITKNELSQARKEKDLVKIGALEGTVKNEELVMDILKKLTKLSEKQIKIAKAWTLAGTAMEDFTAADTAFDPFRGRSIVRPEEGEYDQRLGAEGYDAFKKHTAAMKTLADAFTELASQTKSLANDRVELLEALAKGGHVQGAAR